jgi:hypothetical protein
MTKKSIEFYFMKLYTKTVNLRFLLDVGELAGSVYTDADALCFLKRNCVMI